MSTVYNVNVIVHGYEKVILFLCLDFETNLYVYDFTCFVQFVEEGKWSGFCVSAY